MRPSPDARVIAGCLALLGVLMLASPGVRAVRADDADASSAPRAEPGQVCRPEPAPMAAVDLGALLERARRRALAEAEPGAETPVLLNNRGYNYGPAPRVDPTAIQLELERRSRQR